MAPRMARGAVRRWLGARASSGFTLVEMAVVLVIIAVIFVAVLQGRALIENAEYKSFKRSLADYAEAFRVFHERYDALPGDFNDPDAQNAIGQDGGDGDGVIEGGGCNASGEESCRAWRHLRAASLIQGDPDVGGGAANPDHDYGGQVLGFMTNDDGGAPFGHRILVAEVPVEIARRLDNDIDDGRCDLGAVSVADTNDCAGNDWDDTNATADLIYVP